MKSGTIIIALTAAFLLGAIPGFLTSRYLFPPRPVVTFVRDVPDPDPHYVGSDGAMNRFGLAPVNPQWFEIGRKDGAPMDAIPAPDQMQFTFPVEPVIEKIAPPKDREWEPAKWKVTFRP